ncbi:MAG TPA: DUF3298 domain-containing protein [Candidatus Paceibacterota bacterium]
MMPRKKSKLLVSAILLVLAGLVTLIFIQSRRPNELPSSVLGVSSSTPALTGNVKVETSKNETADYQTEVNIPQFENPGDSFALQHINKQIKDNVGQLVMNFTEEIQQIKTESPDSPFNDPSLPKHSLMIKVASAKEVSGKYFVVELKDYSYVSGSAHPFTATIAYNFDLKTGDLIGLSDIYKDKAQFLQAVSTFAKKELQPKLESFFEDGISPQEQNFSVYTLVEGGIRFVFDQYQVAPYAAGEQSVTVPASALAGQLKIAL